MPFSEYKQGMLRQGWFIPLADDRAVCTACKTVRSLESACHTWAP